jgi:DNA-binding CsgD family transcriptional regulator
VIRVGLGEALERAAVPVLDSLIEDLADTNVALVLTDSDGRSLRRWEPKTSRDEGSATPSVDDLTFSASASINDPRVGRPLAVLHLMLKTRRSNPLMPALAKRAAREIEDRLVDGAGASDRVLMQHFLRARRGAKGPMLVVSETLVMANTAADRLISSEDERLLRRYASSVGGGASLHVPVVVLSSGVSTELLCEPIAHQGVSVGAVVRLAPHSTAAHSRSVSTTNVSRSTFGWESITDSERTIGQLVAEGLTNREVAARLFVSHHTVDSQLRSIFRKLSVCSRVELTRLVLERELQPSH